MSKDRVVQIVQYHEVKISMEFRYANELIVSLTAAGERSTANNTTTIFDNAGVQLSNTSLWVDYVYLDTDERSISMFPLLFSEISLAQKSILPSQSRNPGMIKELVSV
jgi:hypothetical protein